ncbi:MAG: DNA-binding protein WhiA [Actinobacteria bacterium]|nr:DNA-binding protein WhiA [Actinomycetota bacterium]MCG2819145.1 DNA-binding protein WhiA [Actinomycetes bacterium]MBU4178627.1 DNA-binding protein WhiA [Actinomycetota bacterium]MBU4219014.1 DNA-binding protein WhiA [Actinomycetota bacterium]MBU4359202.1 DNA-binding protein WhiA [Actinomycetota bacterium]
MTSAVQKVKEEIAHHRSSRRCCQLAELSALLHMDGTYSIRGGGRHVLVTDSAGVNTARKIYTLLHTLFEVETPVIKIQRSSPRHQNVYRLEFEEQPGFHQVLNELGVLDNRLSPEHALPVRLTRNDCCAAAALRGAFLGGGYISESYKPADLEISVFSRDAALSLEALFIRKSLEPGIRARRGHWVLYLKKRTSISAFLAIVGAHQAHLQWESQGIMRSTRNCVNRLVNCDAANARRLAEASTRQREVVNELITLGILGGADPVLVELAETRLRYPQASLAELGKLLDPPASKPCVQGRMRRLESLLPAETAYKILTQAAFLQL